MGFLLNKKRYGFAVKDNDKKKERKKEEDTFFITEGKIKTDLESRADELRYALEEGYSDQTVLNNAMLVEAEINNLKKKLEAVV